MNERARDAGHLARRVGHLARDAGHHVGHLARRVVHHVGHLARRLAGSLSRRPPPPYRDAWARSLLLPGEVALWDRMGNTDRRHSVEVARRFRRLVETPTRDELAAALLHDVGKIESGLGTTQRVVATLVGPRTARLRRYHDHERIGVELLVGAGSTEETLALARGEHPHTSQLRAADDI